MNFTPVRTKAEADTLNLDDVIDGYRSAVRGDPEPGANRGKAFWHGWRARMIDHGELPNDDAHQQLTREIAPAGRVTPHGMQICPVCRSAGKAVMRCPSCDGIGYVPIRLPQDPPHSELSRK